MSKHFSASDEFGVVAIQNMDPFNTLAPGTGMKSGIVRACVTVHEPGDEAHPSLPTLRRFLEQSVDAETGILTNVGPSGVRLSMDPTPLRDLPPEYLDYRVSPGSSFVTHEAIAKAKQKSG